MSTGIGMLLILLLVIIVGIIILLREKNSSPRIVDQLQLLKSQGTRIKVDLRNCEIKTNHYTEEQEKYNNLGRIGHEIQFINAITGNEMSNVQQVEILQSVVVYKYQESTYYSRIIPKDQATLTFLLDHKKETYIYVDPRTGAYYFDLEFLFNEG